MDDVLGRLFDFIDNSPLRNNTYVMIMSDNGSELFDGELSNKLVRLQSFQWLKRLIAADLC
jgi:arylsulfatase A-like enzyme